MFADILLVPHALGVKVSFEAGEGPVLETVADAKAVAELDLAPCAPSIHYAPAARAAG